MVLYESGELLSNLTLLMRHNGISQYFEAEAGELVSYSTVAWRHSPFALEPHRPVFRNIERRWIEPLFHEVCRYSRFKSFASKSLSTIILQLWDLNSDVEFVLYWTVQH